MSKRIATRREGLRPSGRPAPKVRPERHAFHVELISVGRELLRGRIADDNTRVLAGKLSQRGAIVHRITTVDDNDRSIAAALREALDRNPNLVVTTGGLGPSENDRTLVAVSDVLGCPMSHDSAVKRMVDAAYQRLAARGQREAGRRTEVRERMYMVPLSSEPVANECGVSPGVICRLPGGAMVLSLPGMPDEMRSVLAAALQVIGSIGAGRHNAQREIEAPTTDEAELMPLIERLGAEFPNVWIDTRPSGSRRRGSKIIITLEASGADLAEARTTADNALRRLLALAAGSP
jgi:molybdenum cofactor synthesis domain-containing protein